MKKPAALGVDIGGTNTDYALVTETGACLSCGTFSTEQYNLPEDYADKLADSLNKIIRENDKEYDIRGIGVGAPNGNSLTGNIEFAPNLKWKGTVRFVEMMQQRTNMRVFLANDANAAAIGEMKYGAAKGMRDFIILTLGTGLGSGIVCNGQLVLGHDGLAGELGHIIVDPNGRLCGCGRRGCLETFVSATGIKRTVIEMLEKSDRQSILRNLEEDQLTSKEIFLAAEKADALALEAFDITAKVLGTAIADMVTFSSPEAVILFGGLAKAGDMLLVPVKKYMEEAMINIYKNKVKVLPSKLQDSNSAILGAAALVWM